MTVAIGTVNFVPRYNIIVPVWLLTHNYLILTIAVEIGLRQP